tara:strand:- start:62 stop:301 length:240 start_codon:yes stop_codon:yes gene_type:complete
MSINRPRTKDDSTLAAEGLSNILSGIEDSIKENNPIGFGQERLNAQQYQKRILSMSKQERMMEMENVGIDGITEALRGS